MKRRNLIVLSLGLILSVPHEPGAASQSVANCPQVSFSEPDAATETYVIDRVEGQAIFAPSAEPQKLGGASRVCVLLFNRRDPTPVAAVLTDDGGSGRFEFRNVAPSEYVLIASRDPFHDIVVPIYLADAPLDPDMQRGLLLRMHAKEDSRKSFVLVIRNLELRQELLAMVRVDQDLARELIQKGVTTPDPELESRMSEVYAQNARRLREMIAKYGWPRPELVGMDGTEAAFLIVQHAPYTVQKELFPLVEAAYRDGALSGQNYALLLDRILVREGKPQVYGTQAKRFDGANEPIFEPIEDEANVDRRRAEVGLPPLAEYREILKRLYFPSR